MTRPSDFLKRCIQIKLTAKSFRTGNIVTLGKLNYKIIFLSLWPTPAGMVENGIRLETLKHITTRNREQAVEKW